ncbi:hypothetical protein GGR52DRAFT_559624 [Hypoxylon sp. FL1284]|nr:hypothetical protein GGR52DRAFT_559624 [Hypoxylon sp. FL1284]
MLCSCLVRPTTIRLLSFVVTPSTFSTATTFFYHFFSSANVVIIVVMIIIFFCSLQHIPPPLTRCFASAGFLVYMRYIGYVACLIIIIW